MCCGLVHQSGCTPAGLLRCCCYVQKGSSRQGAAALAHVHGPLRIDNAYVSTFTTDVWAVERIAGACQPASVPATLCENYEWWQEDCESWRGWLDCRGPFEPISSDRDWQSHVLRHLPQCLNGFDKGSAAVGMYIVHTRQYTVTAGGFTAHNMYGPRRKQAAYISNTPENSYSGLLVRPLVVELRPGFRGSVRLCDDAQLLGAIHAPGAAQTHSCEEAVRPHITYTAIQHAW